MTVTHAATDRPSPWEDRRPTPERPIGNIVAAVAVLLIHVENNTDTAPETASSRRAGVDRLERLVPVSYHRIHRPSQTTSAHPVRNSPDSFHSTRCAPPGDTTSASRSTPA